MNLDVAKALIDHGADINAQCDAGRTPLHGAARRGNMEVAVLLCGLGANIELRNKKGESALDKARNVRKHNMVELLSRPGEA